MGISLQSLAYLEIQDKGFSSLISLLLWIALNQILPVTQDWEVVHIPQVQRPALRFSEIKSKLLTHIRFFPPHLTKTHFFSIFCINFRLFSMACYCVRCSTILFILRGNEQKMAVDFFPSPTHAAVGQNAHKKKARQNCPYACWSCCYSLPKAL